MAEEIKEVEKSAETASTQSAEVDIEVELAAAQAELEKVAAERDNYKEGMLVAKGKKPAVEADSDDLETIIDRKVNEKLLSLRELQAQQKLADINKKILKENKELRLANQNRIGLGGSSGGKSEDVPEVKDAFFSKEQLADLTKRKLNPEKVKANILKNRAKNPYSNS